MTYDRLNREKGENETFRDVMDRLLEAKDGEHPLYSPAGLYSESDIEELRTHSQQVRKHVEGRIRDSS